MSVVSVKKKFTKAHVEHFKNNKHLITSELLDALRSQGNEGKSIALDILDTHKDEEHFYLDDFGNRISYMGIKHIRKEGASISLSEIHQQELKRCMEDPFYFIANYIRITTKSGLNFPDFRQYQLDFIEALFDNESVVANMPRQASKTTSTALYLIHCVIFGRDFNTLIVANVGKMAREFLDKIKKMYVTLPMWMQQGITVWNKTYVEFGNNCRVMSDAVTDNAGRGFTFNKIVADELAHVPLSAWDGFADSVFPASSAMSHSKSTILLSTPKGLNHFYAIFKSAKEGTNGFVPFEMNWEDVPRYDKEGKLYEPERFKNEMIAKYGMQYWKQNFECSFIGSSHTLVSSDILSAMKSKDPELMKDGILKIYHEPIKGHQYVMGVDPSMGIGGDYFGVQVLDITNLDMKQVASARLDMEYLKIPDYLHEWCQYYNNAYLIIENNLGSGQSISDMMVNTYEYENMHFDKSSDTNKRKKYSGFRTTTKTRKQILDNMKLFIQNGKLEINDSDTYKEFFSFIYSKGKYQADDGAKDDMIMALAICFAPFCNMKNFEDMREVTKLIFSEAKEDNNAMDLLSFGFFDSGVEETQSDGSWTYEMPYAHQSDNDPFG